MQWSVTGGMTLTLTDHTNLLWLISFTQILIRMWMPALRWSIAQTIYQFFVCLIDKCQDIREHSIFVIKATLMWTSIFGDVNAVDWINVCDKSNDIHEEEANCISILNQIADKHAPVKKASQNKRRQLAKPWLTRGVLTSVKHKRKLYQSHFLSRDPDKVRECKLYANTLNRIKNKAKNDYYCQRFKFYQNGLKNIWKLIGTLVPRKN